MVGVLAFCIFLGGRGGKDTWNYQGLAAHDEDDLHGTEAVDSELSLFVEGDAELGDEDETEPADTDCCGDILGAFKPVKG